MIQQDHLQIFDLTLNVWAPLFVGNGSSYTKKEYMYNTRNGKVSFLDEQKFFSFLVEHDLVDKYGQFMLSEQSNLWAFLTKDCGISDAELKTLTRYQIEVGDALDAEHSLKEIHAFQRDAQGHAYIPGSSIKGALRYWLTAAPDTALHKTAEPPFQKRNMSTSCICMEASLRTPSTAFSVAFRFPTASQSRTTA